MKKQLISVIAVIVAVLVIAVSLGALAGPYFEDKMENELGETIGTWGQRIIFTKADGTTFSLIDTTKPFSFVTYQGVEITEVTYILTAKVTPGATTTADTIYWNWPAVSAVQWNVMAKDYPYKIHYWHMKYGGTEGVDYPVGAVFQSSTPIDGEWHDVVSYSIPVIGSGGRAEGTYIDTTEGRMCFFTNNAVGWHDSDYLITIDYSAASSVDYGAVPGEWTGYVNIPVSATLYFTISLVTPSVGNAVVDFVGRAE